MVVAEEQRAPTTPVPPARSQRTRRPPGYLADYAVGHLELPPREGSPSSPDDYPILVGNSLHYPGEFHQEEGNAAEARGSAITTLATTLATRIPGANSKVNFKFILDTLASVMGPTLPEEQSAERLETEEASQTDSSPAPVSAPSSQQDAAAASVVCSTITSSPSSKPVELQLTAEEEQGILSGDHPDGLDNNTIPAEGGSPAHMATTLQM